MQIILITDEENIKSNEVMQSSCNPDNSWPSCNPVDDDCTPYGGDGDCNPDGA